VLRLQFSWREQAMRRVWNWNEQSLFSYRHHGQINDCGNNGDAFGIQTQQK
jgi:hypothetical protein